MPQNTFRTPTAFLSIVLLSCGYVAFAIKSADPSHYHLTAEVSSSAPSSAQLFFDVGHGFNEADSQSIPIAATPANTFHTLTFDLPSKRIYRLRFDPSAVPGTYAIHNIVVSDARRVLLKIAPSDITSLNQIQTRTQLQGTVTFVTVPNGTDPSILLGLQRPLDCSHHASTYLALLILDGALLYWVVLRLTRPASDNLSIAEVIRATVILAGVIQICYFPAIWGDRTMLESAQDAPSVLPDGAWTTQPKTRFEFYKVLDAGAPAWTTEAYFPLEQYIYSQERVAPLWNPYQAFGSPLAANMQSQPFSPLTMMLLLHLTPRTYNLYLLTRLLIVGVGMFVYLRYFVAFWAALCGAIITSLGGYYNFYVAMPHISVEMLLPFCLVAVEYVIRSRSYRALLTLSGIVFLIIVGGMPESTALQLTFITMYVLCRVATDGMLSGSRTRCLLTFGGGTLAGILLASFLILPFTEFMHHSFNVHETRYTAGVVTGMLHAPLNDGLWAYLFPLLLGHPDGINPLNYVGVIPFFAMLVALGCLWRWKLEDRSLNVLTIFFSLSVIWVVGKRCGLEPINMIGALPVFKMVNFIKYNEPLLTVSVAVLAAIGVEHIYRRRMPYVVLEAALFLAVLTIPLALIMSWEDLRRIFGDNHVDIQLVLIAVGVPSSVLLMTILAFLHYKSVGDGGRRVAVFLACAITAELSLNVIVPDYRIIGTLPYDRQNPYAASPYITFLKKQILNQERIVGRDVVLHPNWASAFQLCDIRDLDALYYDKYFRFLWTFLPGAPSGSDELRNRYTGGIAAYNFDTPLQRRLLQLSSVRYLLSERAFPPGAATSQELPHSAHPESQTRPLFNLIYAKEAMVYQYDDVLPRAALYFRAEAPRGGDDGLKRLADPSLDIFSTVVLDAAQMDQNQKAIVRGMDSNIEFRRVEPAQIRKYTSREVEVQSQADRSAILVLNDSDYPGWSVDVDGRKDRIISANYIFRGVMIPPGKHLVRFTYDPARFRIGKAISFTTLLALIAGALMRKTIAEKNSRSMLAVQQTSTC